METSALTLQPANDPTASTPSPIELDEASLPFSNPSSDSRPSPLSKLSNRSYEVALFRLGPLPQVPHLRVRSLDVPFPSPQ
jgi:hypothetical protein